MSELVITIDEEELKVKEDDMKIVRVNDRGGNPIKFQIYEGVHYGAVYSPRILGQIKTVHLREDDIFLSSYLRTGTHWIFEMASMLLNGKAETIKKFKGKNQLEFMTNEELSCLPSPRLINTHMKLSMAPAQLKEKKCKVIFTLRDPKDVAVSLYLLYSRRESGDIQEYSGSFGEFLSLFYDGKVDCNGLFEHWRDADKFFKENPDIPVHFPMYEETSKDPVKEVQALSDFIGLPRNDKLCREIAEKCEFSNMLMDKENYSMKVNGKSILFRKGIVGDWQNWFTDELLEEFYRIYEDRLAGIRFYQRYARLSR